MSPQSVLGLYGWRNGFVYSRLTEARTGRSARVLPSQARIPRFSYGSRVPGPFRLPERSRDVSHATENGWRADL